MTEKQFKSEMSRADLMRLTAHGLDQEYWEGYQRGLRRVYHGERFGTEEEHEMWLGLSDDRDESRRQRGEGYRAGLTSGGQPQITLEALRRVSEIVSITRLSELMGLDKTTLSTRLRRGSPELTAQEQQQVREAMRLLGLRFIED